MPPANIIFDIWAADAINRAPTLAPMPRKHALSTRGGAYDVQTYDKHHYACGKQKTGCFHGVFSYFRGIRDNIISFAFKNKNPRHKAGVLKKKVKDCLERDSGNC
jgi:hypothetical protein